MSLLQKCFDEMSSFELDPAYEYKMLVIPNLVGMTIQASHPAEDNIAEWNALVEQGGWDVVYVLKDGTLNDKRLLRRVKKVETPMALGVVLTSEQMDKIYKTMIEDGEHLNLNDVLTESCDDV